MPPLPGLPALLTGRWTVRRRMEDRLRQRTGSFDGVATFAPDGAGGLVWEEEGRMRFGAHDGPARRRLLIVPPADADAGAPWEVRFEDGRPFHPLDLGGGACTVEHLCGPDVYTGEYLLRDGDHLDVTWRVAGPDTDDEIRSRYARVSRPAAPAGS